MEEVSRETIERARKGDVEAFRLIVSIYQKPVVSAVYRFAGSRLGQEAEDIAQEIFVKVFRSIHRFDFSRQTRFSTWVFTFVRNHCYDVLKKRQLPVQSLEAAAGDGAVPELPAGGPRPSRLLLNDELGAHIENAVLKLPAEQRLAFILREYEGLGYSEIAQILDCSIGTVKSRIHRAKEALRSHLQDYL